MMMNNYPSRAKRVGMQIIIHDLEEGNLVIGEGQCLNYH